MPTTNMLLQWLKYKPQHANTYSGHHACNTLRIRVVISKNNIYRNENQNEEFFFIHLMMIRGEEGGGREEDGRPLVSWLGRIRAVWDRSDLTQPSFSRTGHVRLDLSHTTDIIPLSGETTAHHHSTGDGGEREVMVQEKAKEKTWERKQVRKKHRKGRGEAVRLRGKEEERKHGEWGQEWGRVLVTEAEASTQQCQSSLHLA